MRSRTTAGRSPVVLALLAVACASARPQPSAAIAPLPPASGPVVVEAVAANGTLRAGVVSVRVTGQDWNWRAPWEKQAPWTRTVTGLVVPGRRILVASTALGNPLLVEAQKLGGDARTVARVELVDHEGPLALVAVDDAAFWEGLSPLSLEPRARSEGAVQVLRWQRTGLLDAYPGTLRQVRSGRHGLSQTSLLTIDVASTAEGLGESEVVVANGRVAGLVTGRAGDTYAAIAAPVLAQFVSGVGQQKTPNPRPEKGEKVELPEVHARHSGGKGDEAANQGEQAAEEDGPLAVLLEPAVRCFDLPVRDQHVLAMPHQQGAGADGSEPINDP